MNINGYCVWVKSLAGDGQDKRTESSIIMELVTFRDSVMDFATDATQFSN